MKKSRKILLSLLATLMVGAACQLFENRIVYILSEDKSYYIIKDIFNCTETNLIIPSTHGGKPVREIGNSAFRDCSSLTSVVIGDSVTSIGDVAFYYCSSLMSVVIGDSVTSIGNGAFYSCDSLTSVVIGDSVTSIGFDAFCYCDSLTSVVIGDSVTSIGNSAFYDCTKLTSVYYKGTASDWSAISIDNTYGYNNSLINATRYYYSENQPTEEGNYWHYVDGKPTIWE